LGRLAERLQPRRSSGVQLLLIGRRQMRNNNSWMHNAPRLMKGSDRCTLLMHPEDAKRRGLSNGQWVEVDSCVGAVIAPLEISDTVMPGVVSLPHGFGHGRRGTRLRTANRTPGVSLNDITDEQSVDALSGTASFSGTPGTAALA
jgi:anaerobic selenocysteine-containing dehydrogenase